MPGSVVTVVVSGCHFSQPLLLPPLSLGECRASGGPPPASVGICVRYERKRHARGLRSESATRRSHRGADTLQLFLNSPLVFALSVRLYSRIRANKRSSLPSLPTIRAALSSLIVALEKFHSFARRTSYNGKYLLTWHSCSEFLAEIKMKERARSVVLSGSTRDGRLTENYVAMYRSPIYCIKNMAT